MLVMQVITPKITPQAGALALSHVNTPEISVALVMYENQEHASAI